MAEIRGEFQTVEYAVLPVGEIQDGWVEGGASPLSLLETQLHNTFRIGHRNGGVKRGAVSGNSSLSKRAP